MRLLDGETLQLAVTVEADDTAQFAQLYLTDRRLVIEFPTLASLREAESQSVLHGSPTPRPLDLLLSSILEVQVVRRFAKVHVLKLRTDDGADTIWLTSEADAIASAILRQRGPAPA